MDRERYFWFQVARELAGRLPEASRTERVVLDDAAEAFLLARSQDEDLEDTIDSASWALTHLTSTGVLLDGQARGLWEAICASGPPSLSASGVICEDAPGLCGRPGAETPGPSLAPSRWEPGSR